MDVRTYQDVLLLGMRNVGQRSEWLDQSGRLVGVDISKFDSNLYFEIFSEIKQADKNNNYPNMGDASSYVELSTMDVKLIVVQFIHENYMVSIKVVDEMDESLNEAIRIAKIVKSRID